MASPLKKFLVLLFLVPSLGSLVSSPIQAASKSPPVRRQWVVKLKQNSWMNRRPFQFATPIVDGELVYVGVHRGLFYAVHAKKGKKVWTFKAQAPIHASAKVQGRMVYFADTKGMVYALNKEDGSLLWASKLDGEIMSAPLIYADKLYVVTLSKELAALDSQKGNLLWQTLPHSKERGFTVRGAADPIFLSGNILVGYSDGTLVAHDSENGNIHWSKQLGDRSQLFHDVDATVLIGGKYAYVSSADGKFFAIDPHNGQTIWQVPVGGVNDAFLTGSSVYVTAGGIAYCLKADTGQTQWEQDLEVPEISSPAIYGEWLAVVATKGKAYFLDRETGDIRHQWYVKGGSYSDPIVSGNQLILLSNASRLYSFQFE